MLRRQFLAAASTGLALAGSGVTRAAFAAEKGAADPRYAPRITTQVGGQPIALVLTGTAMRTKYYLKVYAIGSYLEDGVKARDADAVRTAKAVKRLELIFERDVDGATMAQSFRESIGMGHPAPKFAAELTKLEQYFRANPCKTGDHLWLTSVPDSGLSCQLENKGAVMIESVAFAQAAWDVYMGPKNLGATIKTGLASRL